MKNMMLRRNKLLFCVMLVVFFIKGLSGAAFAQEKYTLVIHGGAGNIDPESLDSNQRDQYKGALALALKAGEDILSSGGSSIDAVETVVKILEDSPLFNAGRGSVFNANGKNEMDASIMCGHTHNAGAVAGITTVKNPIHAARLVMEESPHVMLSGRGAETFSYENGAEIVDPGYFFEQRRWRQYQEHLRRNINLKRGNLHGDEFNKKMGTVGAVALDTQGNIAAATSTGGMTGKKYGRIGDSPVIGAGNYASNLACGVSATGHGEYFIRNMVAYDIAARMQYKGQSLAEASYYVIRGKIDKQGAYGGIIAVDKDGNIAMEFNTSAMFRGMVNSEGDRGVWIFRQ